MTSDISTWHSPVTPFDTQLTNPDYPGIWLLLPRLTPTYRLWNQKTGLELQLDSLAGWSVANVAVCPQVITGFAINTVTLSADWDPSSLDGTILITGTGFSVAPGNELFIEFASPATTFTVLAYVNDDTSLQYAWSKAGTMPTDTNTDIRLYYNDSTTYKRIYTDNAVNFNFPPEPPTVTPSGLTITAVSLGNDWDTIGGSGTVQISGTGFLYGPDGSTAVSEDGGNSWDSANIFSSVYLEDYPSGVWGVQDVQVQTSDPSGGNWQYSNMYTFDFGGTAPLPPPVNVNPAYSGASVNYTWTLNATSGLSGVTDVLLNGVSCQMNTWLNVNSDINITGGMTPGPIGPVDVTLLPWNITYNQLLYRWPDLVYTSCTPTSVPYEGGFGVTLVGNGFVSFSFSALVMQSTISGNYDLFPSLAYVDMNHVSIVTPALAPQDAGHAVTFTVVRLDGERLNGVGSLMITT